MTVYRWHLEPRMPTATGIGAKFRNGVCSGPREQPQHCSPKGLVGMKGKCRKATKPALEASTEAEAEECAQ